MIAYIILYLISWAIAYILLRVSFHLDTKTPIDEWTVFDRTTFSLFCLISPLAIILSLVVMCKVLFFQDVFNTEKKSRW